MALEVEGVGFLRLLGWLLEISEVLIRIFLLEVAMVSRDGSRNDVANLGSVVS